MQSVLTKETAPVTAAAHYWPAVSVIMPFDPKMVTSSALRLALKSACRKIERQLLDNYPSDIALIMMAKFNDIVERLNFSTHRKSIAIFASPVFEKVIYLDIPVEERITVGGSFAIRDLLRCRKNEHRYLVLQLGEHHSHIYSGNAGTLVKILSATPRSEFVYENTTAEKPEACYGKGRQNEISLQKFLRQVDNTLNNILRAYPLPLFIAGPESLTTCFKALTAHGRAVIDYVYADNGKANEKELAGLLAPYVGNWKQVEEKNILNKLKETECAGNLLYGMGAVWYASMRGQGQLLLLEENFSYDGRKECSDGLAYGATKQYNAFSCTSDEADEVIEKVLQNGGDIAFAPERILKDYNHIALIKSY